MRLYISSYQTDVTFCIITSGSYVTRIIYGLIAIDNAHTRLRHHDLKLSSDRLVRPPKWICVTFFGEATHNRQCVIQLMQKCGDRGIVTVISEWYKLPTRQTPHNKMTYSNNIFLFLEIDMIIL